MKDNKILEHYKTLFENYLFDEYDILGFLIFIREQVDKKKCQFIHEFADLIAHRCRNKGIIKENILRSISNDYLCNKDGYVKEYNGIKWEIWVNEWKILGEHINFDFTKDNKKILKQITVCIISLAQDTKYYDKNVIIGKVKPCIDGKKYLCLITTEDKSNSKMVCLMKCGPFKDIIYENHGFFDYPLETKREDNNLCLYYNENKILEI